MLELLKFSVYNPFILVIMIGPTAVLVAVYLVLHFIAKRRKTRLWRALNIGALAALVSHLAIVAFIVISIITNLDDPQVIFGLLNIPFFGGPVAAVAFVLVSVVVFLTLPHTTSGEAKSTAQQVAVDAGRGFDRNIQRFLRVAGPIFIAFAITEYLVEYLRFLNKPIMFETEHMTPILPKYTAAWEYAKIGVVSLAAGFVRVVWLQKIVALSVSVLTIFFALVFVWPVYGLYLIQNVLHLLGVKNPLFYAHGNYAGWYFLAHLLIGISGLALVSGIARLFWNSRIGQSTKKIWSAIYGFILRRKKYFLIGSAVVILVGGAVANYFFPGQFVTIRTDRKVYRPGEPVQITARNFSLFPVSLKGEYNISILNENTGEWFGITSYSQPCCDPMGFCPIGMLAPRKTERWLPYSKKAWTWNQEKPGCQDGESMQQQALPGQYRVSIFVGAWSGKGMETHANFKIEDLTARSQPALPGETVLRTKYACTQDADCVTSAYEPYSCCPTCEKPIMSTEASRLQKEWRSKNCKKEVGCPMYECAPQPLIQARCVDNRCVGVQGY